MQSEYPLPRIERISIAELESSYLEPQKPCIIAGLAKWPASELWDRVYLRNVFGNTVVSASHSANHIHPDLTHAPAPPPTINLKFADYIDLVWSGATAAKNLLVIGDKIPIFSHQPIAMGEVAPLKNDIELPEFIDRTRLWFVGVWLSAHGIESRLHYDANGCHNLNVQIRGSKRVIMCSPDQCELVYPYSRILLPENYGQFSQVNPFQPDLERFPLYSQSTRWTGTLQVGDALFVPSYWYHAFCHAGDVNINVNFWWVPERQFVNGITMREVFIAALSQCVRNGDDAGGFAAKLATLDRNAKVLMQSVEMAMLSPVLPGRSERV
jgi:Cupin-like domain